jgi:hypothetical protein
MDTPDAPARRVRLKAEENSLAVVRIGSRKEEKEGRRPEDRRQTVYNL